MTKSVPHLPLSLDPDVICVSSGDVLPRLARLLVRLPMLLKDRYASAVGDDLPLGLPLLGSQDDAGRGDAAVEVTLGRTTSYGDDGGGRGRDGGARQRDAGADGVRRWRRGEGAEWETFKENVRLLKHGRNVGILNRALKAHADPAQRVALLAERRRMIEAIDDYQGEDPLQPWVDCIKWVQELFPTDGECLGLVVIYEQCVRAFWHDERYKDDIRYLKVWLEYAGNCADAEVIFRFLEANQIGEGHVVFYIRYEVQEQAKES